MTFVSQLDPQTFTWFDHAIEDSSRTVADLVRSVATRKSSSSLRLYVQQVACQQCQTSSTATAVRLRLQVNNVELHQPTVRGPV